MACEYESDLRGNENYLSSDENKAWKKNSGLYGIWIHDHSVTGAALYQLSWPANWELDIMLILYKPVKRWINDWANSRELGTLCWFQINPWSDE